MEFYNDYLAHHGVKGQKWGKITWLDKLGIGSNPEIKALVSSYMNKYDNYKNLKALSIAGKATKDQVENAKTEAKDMALKYREALTKLANKAKNGTEEAGAETSDASTSAKSKIQEYLAKEKAKEEAAPAIKAQRKAEQDAIKAKKKAEQAEKDAEVAAEAAKKREEKEAKQRAKEEKAAAKAQQASSGGGGRSSGGGGSSGGSSGSSRSSEKKSESKEEPNTLFEDNSSRDPKASFTSSNGVRGTATSSTFNLKPTTTSTRSTSSNKPLRDIIEERLGNKNGSLANTSSRSIADIRARLERAKNGYSNRFGKSSNAATESSISRRRTSLGSSSRRVRTAISKDIKALNIANKRNVFDSWLSITNG